MINWAKYEYAEPTRKVNKLLIPVNNINFSDEGIAEFNEIYQYFYNLEKEGYEVDCAYSAEEALSHDLASYSLFLLDIMMDRLSGFDFAKRLKNNISTESTPIIFCSALDGEDDTVMGLNIGGDDYIKNGDGTYTAATSTYSATTAYYKVTA